MNYSLKPRNYSRLRLTKILLFLVFGFLSGNLLAQTLQMQGVVTDPAGIPLLGVNVINEKTKNGVITDFDGAYTIPSSEGDWLVFSYLGYATKRIQISQTINLNVILQESVNVLDDVVVVGYGSIKSSKISSSVAKINSEELNNSTYSRVENALAGKLAGVQVQQTSGRPGASADVKIRGVSSISNSNGPLYVVDGFPISGDLGAINPQDIQSIEVLKDAASSAIYGSRGANGVILITTKQGSEGKSTIQFSTSLGFQNQLGQVGVLNRDEYIKFAIEERTNSAIYQGIDPSTLTTRAPSHQYSIDPKWISDPTSFPDNNWQDLISRTAPISNYQLSASGKSENFKYYSSINYLDQLGIIKETGFKRVSFRTNLESNISKKLTYGLNLNISNSTREDPDTNGAGGPISRSLLVAPIIEIGQQTQDGGYYPYHASFYLNPITLTEEVDNTYKELTSIANSYLSLELLEDLVIKSSVGFNLMKASENYYITNNINRGRGSRGNARNSSIENFLTETTMNYSKEFNSFGLSALAGFSFQKERYENYFFEKTGFPDDDIKTLNAGTDITSAYSTASEWSLLSYFGRLNMDYENKYLLTASVRRDGSSRFGSNSKWGVFPALSVGWNLKREDFLNDVDLFSSLKLRGSYGTTGNNNIGNYSSIARMDQNNYVDSSGNVVNGFSVGDFPNPDLTWETTKIFDFGIDVGILQNRINFTADYYISNTSDLLLNVPIPSITGNTAALQNIGKVENKGFEFEFQSRNIVGNFNWTTSFNFSHNENVVKELGPTGSPIYGITNGYTVTKTEIGKPIGSYYMFETNGIFQNQNEVDNSPTYKRQGPGDLKYVDQNGDGKITFEEDRTYVGNNLPQYVYSLTNQFDYNNFSLSVLMNAQTGGKLLNISGSEHGQSRGNVYDYWLKRWRSPDDPGDGKTPRAAVTDNLTTASDFWTRKTDYFLIRNVSLGYQFTKSVLDKIGAFSAMRIYFTIDNLMMVDDYYHNVQTGTFSNTALVPGVDRDATYPLARTFNFGLDITF